jgi:hypothetical protein
MILSETQISRFSIFSFVDRFLTNETDWHVICRRRRIKVSKYVCQSARCGLIYSRGSKCTEALCLILQSSMISKQSEQFDTDVYSVFKSPFGISRSHKCSQNSRALHENKVCSNLMFITLVLVIESALR